MTKKALIIGAGPAGLTAAYELLATTDIVPIIVERTAAIGGIAKTVLYRGNRMDIGGHRFFSKSDRVTAWWLDLLPLQGAPARDDRALERTMAWSTAPDAPDPEQADRVMLLRGRLSRILYGRAFYNYPLALNGTTIRNLGFKKLMRMAFSYAQALMFPRTPERSLEDFIINRFGNELFATFFRDYTKKVWGVWPSAIPPDWGAQRIKGVSIAALIRHACAGTMRSDNSHVQRGTETSLIERFLYPKYGPGQLWEEVAARIVARGGTIVRDREVIRLEGSARSLERAIVRSTGGRACQEVISADYVFSSMPVKDLIASLALPVTEHVAQVAGGLCYREFVTVGVLVKKLAVPNATRQRTVHGSIPDLWVYVQEPDVRVGRIQIFNNWSPYLVRDESTIWLGLEYFCNEGDELWSRDDAALSALAIEELERIGFADRRDVLDTTVERMPKTYPAYFGSYRDLACVRQYVDQIDNLFLIGRNGQHRYNNMDHSMLTAMEAVGNVRAGVATKDNVWAVNTEETYAEERRA